ncbi:MAG: hypothetical protein U0414_25115 [Polyangiaceae bacterium]
MNLTLERQLKLHERNEDGREVEQGRIGACGLVSGEARVHGSGVEAELQLPGVDWAYENSDMVLQDGGYRWLPAVGF